MRGAVAFGWVVAVGAAVAGCGSSSNPAGPADASVGDSAIEDTGAGGSNVCVEDADLTTATPQDAALDDAGASVGRCITCARVSCAAEVAACNADCECNVEYTCLFNCLSSVGGGLVTCAAECLTPAADGGEACEGGVFCQLSPNARNLLFCAGFGTCSDPCGLGNVFGKPPGDAGGDDGGTGDAGGDAAVDAGASDAAGE